MKPVYFARVALLALLYIVMGKLGLLLAVPPGYATLIWPASGIAIGMLIVLGGGLWPGVLVGSFVLNAWNSGAFADGDTAKLLAAACIAAGSTLQALVGRALIARFAGGLPLQLESARRIIWIGVLAGPVACVIAASVGVGSLVALGIVARAEVVPNWIAWWSGDTFGVLVFMPLVLLSPLGGERVSWRGTPVSRLPFAALFMVLLPLGLTFFAWKTTVENDYRRGEAKFETLTIESEKALQNRLASYGNALLGATGFVQGSSAVSRAEWRTYVETIKVQDNFPGINGVGWIEPVEQSQLGQFVADVRADGAPAFGVHPTLAHGPHYIIRYIEPLALNEAALGLDLAFEEQRLQTAQVACDTGHAAITGRVTLVQDREHAAGFLMLYPVFRQDMPIETLEGRRAALRGFTYAPFIAHHFLDGLTQSQSTEMRLTIYDGVTPRPESLIFRSDAAPDAHPAFSKHLTLRIQQRHWLLVWESTPQFERSERSANPLFLLIGGLLFTALLALLLVVLTVRRTEHLQTMLGKRLFAAPLLVLAVLAAGAFALYSELLDKERHDIRRQLADEASETDARVHVRLNDRVDALVRMARRWEAAGGTPEALWRRDAGNHIDEIQGLRAMEWIDSSFHVRWVQPTVGNEAAVGLDLTFDAARSQALRGAAEHRDATITPPLDLVQGYPALIVYIPVRRDGKFDGFLAGIFEAQDFFSSALRVDQSRDFIVSVLHGGRSYFANSHDESTRAASWTEERTMRLAEQDWMLRIEPTAVFIDAQKSSLPALVLAAGLLVAALAALSVRYILISRLHSARLAKSSALNAGIISSSAHLVIAIDPQYRIMIFNRAAENALGYRAAEVIGMRAIPWFMLPEELEQRARALSLELGEEVPVGPQIFTRIPLRDGKETREWHFVRKDGSRFPVSVIITPLRDEAGTLTGFLGVIEDVTTRREMDRMKSEFTAVVSHELRTPLTSIRGSLGLILGALATSLPAKVKDLLEIAQTNCERLVLLVNDILDVEKFGAGQMRFDMRDASLAAVLLQAVEANEGYARKFNARIEVAHVDAAWRVTTDPDRFIQVMSNLLSNATKFSPSGGVVRVWAERAGSDVRILVRDHGPGIPDEFRGRIFEKFSQADSSATRKKGGTGLGLHIARRFVERMGGRIGFESEAGRGATFWIELPLAIESQPVAESTA